MPLVQLTKDIHLAKSYNGKKVKVWGYVAYDAISTCGMASWYFSIKTDTYDSDTIHINTPASYDFAELYYDLRDIENRQKNAKIFVIGTLHTSDNASNFSTLVDFDIDVNSPNDIKVK
jgi:hypothetical protein